ncbi:hypothetical protein Tco_0667905 [Tanacetum coccineum]
MLKNKGEKRSTPLNVAKTGCTTLAVRITWLKSLTLEDSIMDPVITLHNPLTTLDPAKDSCFISHEINTFLSLSHFRADDIEKSGSPLHSLRLTKKTKNSTLSLEPMRSSKNLVRNPAKPETFTTKTTKSTSSQPPKPKPAPAKPQEKKRKRVLDATKAPSQVKHSKAGREPDSGKLQPLPEVQASGKKDEEVSPEMNAQGQEEGQGGTNPGDAGVSQTPSSHVVHAGPNLVSHTTLRIC